MEEWRDIKGFEGRYQASALGRIRSLRSLKIIKPCNASRGYVLVTLYFDGGRKSVNVHRLIAAAFLPNPDNLPSVNHKDLDKKNNVSSNLEWVTAKENSLHASARGAMAVGARNWNTKLSTDQVLQIRSMLKAGHTKTFIGEVHGVHRTTVLNIAKGKVWRHV